MCKCNGTIPELTEEQRGLLNIPPKPKREIGKREVGRKVKIQNNAKDVRNQPIPSKIVKRRSTIAVARHDWQPIEMDETIDPMNGIVIIREFKEVGTQTYVQDDSVAKNDEPVCEVMDMTIETLNSSLNGVEYAGHGSVFDENGPRESVEKSTAENQHTGGDARNQPRPSKIVKRRLTIAVARQERQPIDPTNEIVNIAEGMARDSNIAEIGTQPNVQDGIIVTNNGIVDTPDRNKVESIQESIDFKFRGNVWEIIDMPIHTGTFNSSLNGCEYATHGKGMAENQHTGEDAQIQPRPSKSLKSGSSVAVFPSDRQPIEIADSIETKNLIVSIGEGMNCVSNVLGIEPQANVQDEKVATDNELLSSRDVMDNPTRTLNSSLNDHNYAAHGAGFDEHGASEDVGKDTAENQHIGDDARNQPRPAKTLERRSTVAVVQHNWHPTKIDGSIELTNGIVGISETTSRESNVFGIESQANVQDGHFATSNEIVDTLPSPLTLEIVEEVIDSMVDGTSPGIMEMDIDFLGESNFEDNETRENFDQVVEAIPSSSSQRLDSMDVSNVAGAMIQTPILKVANSAKYSGNKNRRVSFSKELTVHEYSDNQRSSDQNKENQKDVRPFDSVTIQGPNKVPVAEFIAVQKNFLASILNNNIEFEK